MTNSKSSSRYKQENKAAANNMARSSRMAAHAARRTSAAQNLCRIIARNTQNRMLALSAATLSPPLSSCNLSRIIYHRARETLYTRTRIRGGAQHPRITRRRRQYHRHLFGGTGGEHTSACVAAARLISLRHAYRAKPRAFSPRHHLRLW